MLYDRARNLQRQDTGGCRPVCCVSCVTDLRQTQPVVTGVFRVVEAKRQGSGFVRVEGELFVITRRPAGLDLAVVLIIVVYVENSGPLRPLVEHDIQPNDILGFFEEVLDAATPVSFQEVALARPARFVVQVTVACVVRLAPVRAATVSFCPLVVR